jgi:phytoene dehydrogenase-like protein
MIYDAVVVGGGAAGLTAAAYLVKYGRSTLLLERGNQCGGLINSFNRDGIIFDSGIRALENAGALFPMLKQLGIEIELIKNNISIGIEDQIIEVESDNVVHDYEQLLMSLYPDSKEDISKIISEIEKISQLMDIQYGINNPLFLDIKEDRDYFVKEVFPWMLKYMLNVPKVSSRNQPVGKYLEKFTDNQPLIDVISQHFFTETPTYFALSYFRLYQDYYYPKGGTGVFSQKLVDFIKEHGGEIRTGMDVQYINLEKKMLQTKSGEEFFFKQLLWAADQKKLYQIIDIENLADLKAHRVIKEKQAFLKGKLGNDSVLTIFLSVNFEHDYFNKISTGHFFYTPSRQGLSRAGSVPYGRSWEEIEKWLHNFFELTTYEISIPVLRDESMAPPEKTGLMVSTLFDYHITKYISDNGWDEKFRQLIIDKVISILEKAIYPGLKESVFESFAATPMTLQKYTGNTDGAITGWSFTNQPVPAESRLVRIGNSVKTPLDDVTQAGQWTYSPSGFPVSLITGKLAADRVNKLIK